MSSDWTRAIDERSYKKLCICDSWKLNVINLKFSNERTDIRKFWTEFLSQGEMNTNEVFFDAFQAQTMRSLEKRKFCSKMVFTKKVSLSVIPLTFKVSNTFLGHKWVFADWNYFWKKSAIQLYVFVLKSQSLYISGGHIFYTARLFAIFFIYSYNVCVCFAGSFWSISISFDFFSISVMFTPNDLDVFFLNGKKRLCGHTYIHTQNGNRGPSQREKTTTARPNSGTRPRRVSFGFDVYALFWFHFT